jgi:dynein heavy chain
LWEDFQKGSGPSRIFVFYQVPYRTGENGEIIEVSGGVKEFIVSDGEKVKLIGKGVYFVRTTDPDNPKDISKGTSDNDVIFGEVSEHAVTTLNTVINQCYKPLVENLAEEEWSKCPNEQKQEFSSVFDKFAIELKEALKSHHNTIKLEQYNQDFKDTARAVNSGQNVRVPPEMMNHFQKIFNEWSTRILDALEGADAEKQEDKEAGPQQELDYWKNRMRKLTGISE